MYSYALGKVISDGSELLDSYIATHQACQNAVSREDSQQAVASDELCAALMDEYVEWLSVLGKEALPEAKSIDWAVKAEEHRQLKIMNMMIDKWAARTKERVRKLGYNGALCGQTHDSEMAQKLAERAGPRVMMSLWSEA